ncbi:MAG TPA: acylneuraminate cytidylyltransferase [Polyangiales bacterium]|nr:acylneuraminate cytidylyltransferase [Polyangiales bacterium]
MGEADPRCCAIIPARGGSKGIAGKNVRMLGGRPLLAHMVLAARAARRIDKVVVSTDDPSIAEVARSYGADVVFRPAELASDTASSESALLHALASLSEQRYEPELTVFLQCTSPLTLAEDIDGTIDKLIEERADSALSVAAFHYFLWKRAGAEAQGVNHDKRVRLRRQDREPEYLETGAVYVMRTAGFLQAKHRFFGKTVVHEMPLERVCEIDELVDLELAELRLRQRAQAARADALPTAIQALVMDFDGVHTDDRVLVDQDGREAVFCNRRDGLGLEQLRKTDLKLLVLSKEQNAVVQARCKKLGLPCLSGIDAKLPALQRWCAEQQVALANTVYVGNDVNDIECLAAVGCGVAVADAHPEAKARARFVLERPGGQGALRELCELILERQRRAP